MTFQQGRWFVIDFLFFLFFCFFSCAVSELTCLRTTPNHRSCVRSSLMIVFVWDQRDNLICRFGAGLKSSGYCSLMKIILPHMPAESTVTAASRNFCFAALKPVSRHRILAAATLKAPWKTAGWGWCFSYASGVFIEYSTKEGVCAHVCVGGGGTS